MAIPIKASYPSAPPYPYPSPPPPHRSTGTNPNNNPQTIEPTRRTSLRQYVCTFVCALIILILVSAFITFIVWLIYALFVSESLTLPEFNVETVTLSPLNTVGSLTATWDITFLASNPNRKYKMYYDSVVARVGYQYGDTFIKLGRRPQLSPFALKERNNTRVNFKIGVMREWCGDGVAQQISYDRSRGLVTFIVRMVAHVRFKAKLKPAMRYSLLVSCNHVDFGFSRTNGTGLLTSQSGDALLWPFEPSRNSLVYDDYAF